MRSFVHMMFPVRCLVGLLLVSSCLGVDYFPDHIGGQSCDSVCQQQQKICAGTGHGFSPDSAQSVFRYMGITCGPDDAKALYKTPDGPNYVSLEFEVYDQCNGYKGIPEQINCSARGDENTRRICPCVQGAFLQFQNIKTLLGSTNVVKFVIDGQLYLAFNRLRAYRRYRSETQIYRLQENVFTFYQTLKSTYNGPGRASYFQIGSNHYIAIPYFSRSGKRAPKTVVYTRIGGYFDAFQELDGGMALATSFIEIKPFKMLVIQGYQALTVYRWRRNRFAKHQVIPIQRAHVTDCSLFTPDSVEFYLACAVWGGNRKSLIFKWSGGKFFVHQTIPGIEYATSAETLKLHDGETSLVLAQRQNGFRARMNIVTHLLTWNKELALFEFNKNLTIHTRGASACRPFKINNEQYIAVSQSADKKSLIYKYKNGNFQIYQELRAVFADDAIFFTHKRIHYLVLATRNMGYSPAFIWN